MKLATAEDSNHQATPCNVMTTLKATKTTSPIQTPAPVWGLFLYID